jgi:hypothetical protein
LTLVAESIVMAAVLAVKPQGLFGAPPAVSATTQVTEQRALYVPPGRNAALGALAAIVLAMLLPYVGDEYTLVLATDVLIFALFAGKPAILDGTWRNGLIRPRRVLRSWRLCGRDRQPPRLADGPCARYCARRRIRGGTGLRLVLRATFGRLSGDAHLSPSRRSCGRSCFSGTR